MEIPEQKSDGKMELIAITSELMPKGIPKFLSVVQYPTIESLIKIEGKKKMLSVLVLLVKDFCSSMNVVRNMNEDQMIETAAMLLDECGNFRLEDYVMMFSLAKKGAFHPEVKIYDRIDIQVITAIADEYWARRHQAGKAERDADVQHNDILLSENQADRQQLAWDDKIGYVKKEDDADKMVNIMGAIEELKIKMRDEKLDTLDESAAREQIQENPNYKNNYKPLK